MRGWGLDKATEKMKTIEISVEGAAFLVLCPCRDGCMEGMCSS